MLKYRVPHGSQPSPGGWAPDPLGFGWAVDVNAGWVWEWGIWSGPGLVWMCSGVSATHLFRGVSATHLFRGQFGQFAGGRTSVFQCSL